MCMRANRPCPAREGDVGNNMACSGARRCHAQHCLRDKAEHGTAARGGLPHVLLCARTIPLCHMHAPPCLRYPLCTHSLSLWRCLSPRARTHALSTPLCSSLSLSRCLSLSVRVCVCACVRMCVCVCAYLPLWLCLVCPSTITHTVFSLLALLHNSRGTACGLPPLPKMPSTHTWALLIRITNSNNNWCVTVVPFQPLPVRYSFILMNI